MYRGVRYGAPAAGQRSPAPEGPDRDDDPVDMTVLALMSEDPPDALPAEGEEAQEPGAGTPWWAGGPGPEEASAGEPEAGGGVEAAVEVEAADEEPEEPPAPGATPDAPPAAAMTEDRPDALPAEGEEAQEPGAGTPWWAGGPGPREASAGEPEAGGGVEVAAEVETAAEEPEEPSPAGATPDAPPAAMTEDPPAVPPAEEGEVMEPITAPPWWRSASWYEEGAEEEPEAGDKVPGMPYMYTRATHGEPDPEAAAQVPEEAHPLEGGEGHAGEDPAAGSGEPDRETPAVFPGLPGAAEAFPEGPPNELIRTIVAEVCPSELLLAGTAQAVLPEWAGAAVAAARNDLAGRRPVDAGEYLRLAIVENALGLHEEADGHLKEALPRSDQFGPVLNALAVTSLARGKIAPAIVYCKEALRETGGDDYVRAVVSSNLGDLYRLQGDAVHATEAYETAIRCLGPQGESDWLSRLHLRLGGLYQSAGHTEQARLHLADAIRLFKDSGDEAGHVRALVALASTLTASGLHDAALRNLEEGVRICLKTGDKTSGALVLDELGVVYMAQDQLTRALAYFECALSIHRELGDRKGEAATLGHMAKIHDSRGDIDEARRFHDAALGVDLGQGGGSAAPGSPEGGDQDSARARLLKAEEIFSRAGSAEQQESERTGAGKSGSGI